jgi:hypothetical protein
MKRIIVAVVLLLGLANCQTAKEERSTHLALPNPGLLKCVASDCSQLWLEKSAEANVIFPKQVTVDMNQSCLYGVSALYDKSVPVDYIKAAIDERYGKWALAGFANSSLKLWRVEPDKFAIQLSVAGKGEEKRNVAEAGTIRVIYLAFGGESACSVPQADD